MHELQIRSDILISHSWSQKISRNISLMEMIQNGDKEKLIGVIHGPLNSV